MGRLNHYKKKIAPPENFFRSRHCFSLSWFSLTSLSSSETNVPESDLNRTLIVFLVLQ